MTAASGSRPPPVGRPRSPLAAFLLNAILPPAGYAYVGSWVTAAVAFLLIVLAPMVGQLVTAAYPPGLYALGLGGIVVGSLSAVLLMGGHAAVLAAKAPPKTGPRLAHLAMYVGVWVVAFGCNALLRAYWPNPTYQVASEAMAPSLQTGDIVLVDGPRALCGGRALAPGQVVVFRRPGQIEPQMHRIVAGPGQTISLDAGRLKIDGRDVAQAVVGSARTEGSAVPASIVQETLPGGARYRTLDLGPNGGLDTVAPVIVPPDAWYLLGDNRDNAADSRTFGPVKTADICAVGQKLVASSKDMRRVGQVL